MPLSRNEVKKIQEILQRAADLQRLIDFFIAVSEIVEFVLTLGDIIMIKCPNTEDRIKKSVWTGNKNMAISKQKCD